MGTDVKKALLSAWMNGCEDCVRLVAALNDAEGGLLLVRLGAWEDVRRHLVTAHQEKLPGYADDCGNCQEWRALAAGRSRGASSVVTRVLGQEDLLHRAGHLLYDGPTAGGEVGQP
jgi:hypothetical protein